MKKVSIALLTFCLFFIIIFSFISCTALGPHYTCTYNGKKFKTYSIYRPYVSLCEYRGGYWGKWYNDNSLRYEVNTNDYNGYSITYFKKYNHPSDFEYKIIVKNYIRNEGIWAICDGEFIVKKTNENTMRSKYTNDITGINALKDIWTFPCTIKYSTLELPEDKYIFPKLPSDMKYCYNIYYNGVGRAFSIHGKWVGADQFDNWN